ncbi:MAG: V-type ATPase subunit [bacterium]|nr:V-type ATPase subunit [bacterium]
MSTAYVQAVASIRALEAKLLNSQALEQLANTANFNDALNEVKHRLYSREADRIQNLQEALELISQEEKNLFAYTAQLVYDPALAEIMSWYGRLIGIKKKIKNTLSAGEQIPVEIKTWPTYIKEAWVLAQKEYTNTTDLKIVDFIVDANYLQALQEVLLQRQSPWLNELCRLAADFYNIKTWLRFKINAVLPKNITALFLNGGEIDRALFLRSGDMTADDFIQLLKYKPYAPELTTSLQQAKQHGEWQLLDLFFANYLINFLRATKLIYDGPEPIVAYLLVRLLELNNIKVILSGKFYNLPKELITRRLSKTYV